jgi:toxin CcdB
MAQFDVHKNAGKQRDSIPFVVVVQSSLFDKYRRRVVVPLVRLSSLNNVDALSGSLNPVFRIDGAEVMLHPLEVVSVAIDQLGEKVANLAEDGDRILAAMDELLTRAWE